jgi:hypothetical protein
MFPGTFRYYVEFPNPEQGDANGITSTFPATSSILARSELRNKPQFVITEKV